MNEDSGVSEENPVLHQQKQQHEQQSKQQPMVEVTDVTSATTTSTAFVQQSEPATQSFLVSAVSNENSFRPNTGPAEDNTLTNQYFPDTNSLPRFISKSYKIDTIPTHIWIQYFSDRIVVGISQLDDGRIGNWILCENEFISSSENPLFTMIDQSMLSTPSSSSTTSRGQQIKRHEITHLLGSSRNDPLLSLYARRIWENFSTSPSTANRPILLGITLKPSSASSSSHNPSTGSTSQQSIKKFNTIVDLVTNLHLQLHAHGGM
jgi:Proteasome assembly chaperone 3